MIRRLKCGAVKNDNSAQALPHRSSLRQAQSGPTD